MTEMGETNERLDADELLIDQIELASEIVRSSQAAVAFQRAFYLEILTFDRVLKEIEDFEEKVKKLQSKLALLINDLEQAENVSGCSRAGILAEKLETLTNSSKEFNHKTVETRRRREPMYNELNEMILRELNKAAVKSVSSSNFREIKPPNLSLFVNDNEFHLIECISDEWCKLRRKLESYFQKYVEDTTSLRVEVFGATYTCSDISSPTNSRLDENGRGLMQKLSGLILQKKTSASQLTVSSISLNPPRNSNGNCKANSRNASNRTDTSFFYCSDSDTQSQEDRDRASEDGLGDGDRDSISKSKSNSDSLSDTNRERDRHSSATPEITHSL